MFPGLNRLDYRGKYWPKKITSQPDETILRWLEAHLHLLPLGPRRAGYDVFKGRDITRAKARALAAAADGCWQAIQKMDLMEFGRQMRASYEAQVALFPQMSNPDDVGKHDPAVMPKRRWAGNCPARAAAAIWCWSVGSRFPAPSS